MTFSVVTPSFNQLDWLRLCVSSVRDQVAGGEKAETGMLKPESNLGSGASPKVANSQERGHPAR